VNEVCIQNEKCIIVYIIIILFLVQLSDRPEKYVFAVIVRRL